MKSKNDREGNITERQSIKVINLIRGCASIISMDISMDMDIHIHGEPDDFPPDRHCKFPTDAILDACLKFQFCP